MKVCSCNRFPGLEAWIGGVYSAVPRNVDFGALKLKHDIVEKEGSMPIPCLQYNIFDRFVTVSKHSESMCKCRGRNVERHRITLQTVNYGLKHCPACLDNNEATRLINRGIIEI